MACYAELIKQDVHYHNARSVSLWPSRVSELAHSIQNELKIPIWLKSGPVGSYTNERAINLFHQLRASDDASNVDLWDVSDKTVDEDIKEHLYAVFNTALVDCARIRAVVETENLSETPFPKESFLVVFVRNAISNAHPRLSSLEDVPVALPQHSSGVTTMILKHMPKRFYAPLVVAIPQEMPVHEATSDPGRTSTNASSKESELFKDPCPTMSEFLDACERPDTPEEVEEEPEAQVFGPQFEAYFLAFPSSASTPAPSICHVPVLCMAEEDQLPVLMSTLLYQRRVWHIGDPLIGLEFSKYATTIRVFVGWLEVDIFEGHVLPQVHIGEIGTPGILDLSKPSGALVVARFLCTLKPHMDAVDDSVRHSVGAVMSDTQLPSSRSWRIDTDARMEYLPSDLENNNKRDMIIRWIKTQEHSEVEGVMSRHKQASTSIQGSATSVPSLQQSTSTQAFYTPSPSSVSSVAQKPDIQESRSCTNTVPTFYSQLSCSAFAATSKKTDTRIFRWLFDRRVVPQSIPVDLEFSKEYSSTTSLIWPDEWHVKEDLPPVDAALDPCVEELLKTVAILRTQRGAMKCVPINEFPVDLRILQQSFSAIFQASRRSHEKTELHETVYEVAWRHDHDRLLYDFFVRLVQPGEGDGQTRESCTSIASLEDPFSRPTLETTLRFPKSDSLQRDDGFQDSLRKLVHLQPSDLRGWLESRGGSLDAMSDEDQHSGYILSQFGSWTREINADTESRMMSKLGQFPSTGKCDAFGRLLVELPHVSSKDVGCFPLVYRTTRNPDEDMDENDVMASATGADANRCTMLSSAVRPAMQSSHEKGTSSAMDTLASKVERLRLEADATYLELPILTAEYKKHSADSFKGTNQLRMYLTASVKFLQAVGITNFAVYGVQTNGPIVVLPAAIVRDDNSVHLFERLVERLDISTPLGAWHYATVLCRLAKNHAKVLEEKFERVKENLITSLRQDGNQMAAWTFDHQMDRLKAEKKAKSPPQHKKKTKQLPTGS